MKIEAQNQFQEYSRYYQKFKENPLARASTEFVLSVILIFLLFVMAIKPTVLTIVQLQNNIDKLSNLNQLLSTKISTIQNLDTQYQSMQDLVTLVNQALPDNHNFLLFEQQFRYLIQRNSLTVAALSFSQFPLFETDDLPVEKESLETNNNNVRGINFSLNASGSYQNVKKFINQLEKHIRLTNIEQVVLEKNSQNSTVSLTISGQVYFGKPILD